MITIIRPYEPPPDYPFDDETSNENEEKRGDSSNVSKETSILTSKFPKRTDGNEMLRTRQYPEVAGLYCGDEKVPALRRFTRYNQSMSQREHPSNTIPVQSFTSNGSCTKSFTKKSHFNFGNWTFREKKQSRPGLPIEMQPKRYERPASKDQKKRHKNTAVEFRFVWNECHCKKAFARQIIVSFFRSQPPPQQKVLNYSPERNQSILERNQPYQTPKFKSETSLEKAATLQQENDSLCVNLGEHRISKKRNRRRDKTRDAWRSKEVTNWSLDDILVWLQAIRLDEVASLFVGYDLKGPDLNQWDHQILTQLGVNDSRIRSKILTELEIVRKGGPLKDVRNTEFDQVLAFETALTPRDLSVTGGRMGCLQVTKVDGSCLPFKENDCLLEINGVSGEHFKSALMLTKFISDADGQPIRFVILRRKEKEDDSTSQTDSSSGISSSPLTPVENVV
ncbi:unnamed protein product, partial [Mesorhabditis belari]|uniref:SAM domain-containing protein n=1 Tax=Mesorhabditis belari TaxID=2138241 RepID=A0AAF3E8I8_9BILA